MTRRLFHHLTDTTAVQVVLILKIEQHVQWHLRIR
jgi:hypothetical protein